MRYNWPGNVRELENAMERAVVLGDTDWVLPEDLPDPLLATALPSPSSKYEDSIIGAKREAIVEAYRQAKGDYRGAAKILNLHPNYLLRLVRNLGLRDDINRLKST
jgi:DNA-binding NtrC family response regulator